MLNSPFLESLISMVFVYGILSVLASLLQELQAQYLEVRPHFLVKAIKRMLSDDIANSKIPSIRSETWEFLKMGLKLVSFPIAYPWMKMKARYSSHKEKHGYDSERHSKSHSKSHDPSTPIPRKNLAKDFLLVDEFYNCSLIKYMGAKDSKKPSYISREAFTTTLVEISHLVKYPLTDSDLDSIDFEPILPRSVKSVLVAFVKEAYRFSWHEKDPEAKKASIDKKYRELIGNWFDETMHRATGWYKRDAGMWLFWWGLVIALILNADTFRLFRYFMKDVHARQIVNSQALQWNDKTLDEKSKLLPSADSLSTPVDSLRARLARTWHGELKSLEESKVFGWDFSLPNELPVDTVKSKTKAMILDSSLQKAFDSLSEELSLRTITRNETDSLFSKLYRDSSKLTTTEKAQLALSRSIYEKRAYEGKLVLAMEKKIEDSLASALAQVNPINKSKGSFIAKIQFSVRDFFARLPGFLWQLLFAIPGLVSTAFAVSFGAPFWFDLLSSLMKLGGSGASVRLSGIKPGDKKG